MYTYNNQGNQVDGDVKPTIVELDIFASNLANMSSKFIIQFFSKCVDKMKNLHKSIHSLRIIGKTPFTTMGITENYLSLPHIDVNDSKSSYII
jgi:hypothetical protein